MNEFHAHTSPSPEMIACGTRVLLTQIKPARMENREALANLMNAVLITRTRDEWIAAFDAAGVPAGPVHSLAEALTHPQTLARGMIADLVHPEAGATKTIGCHVHFSRTPTRIDRPAPLLGEHTRELLRDYGYTDTEIADFIAAGVVAATAEPAQA